MLGKSELQRIYNYADVFHCEDIDSVADNFIERNNIAYGNFDNVLSCKHTLPTHWDIGKVYTRLILYIGGNVIDTLINVYNSWINNKLSDFNIAVYYMSPEYIYACYVEGKILE